MFERLGSLTYRFRFLIVLAWAGVAGWAVLFAPSLASEGMTDQTAFLPAYTESMQAHDALERTFPGSTSASSATITFFHEGGLTDADRAYRTATGAWITGDTSPIELREAVTSVDTVDSRPEMASMLQSDDGQLELMNVNLDVVMAGGTADVVIAALRDHLASTAPDGLETHVTGAAGIGSDYLTAIVAGTESTTLVTVLLVVLILLLIYRAPLAAMVPLVTIGAAFVVAHGTLGVLALAGWKVSSLLDTFIVVLIFGVGTDYAIFLISRYREEVAKGNWHDASVATVGRIGAVISASAATVVVGLGAMAFGDFGMIQTTGPALAVGILVTLVAGLTLTPALLAIFGHYLFWPRHSHAPGEGRAGRFFARLADMVSHRPGLVTAVLLVALAIPVLYVPQMKTNFDVLAELPEGSDARAGFEQVATHLGRGKVFQSTGIVEGGAGVDLLEPASLARLLATMQELGDTPGVASATSLVTPHGDGILPDGFRPSRQLGEMADAFAGDETGGAPADAETLADPEVTDGLATATTYLNLLGDAFPDIRAGTEYRAATARLARATDQVEQAREGAVVSTQLRALADAMTSPATAAGAQGDTSGSVGMIDDYLDELATAYPEVTGLAAFDDAKAAAGSLAEAVTIPAALDLSAALEDLAIHFDERPGATLFPESLAGTAEAQKVRREIEATFEQLPVDLGALAAVFAPRSDDIFVPVGIGGDEGADLAEAVDAFVSADRSSSRFYVATNDDPYSETGFASVRRAQEVLAAAAPAFGPGTSVHLGGTTAQFADVQEVLGRDTERVGMITVIGILLVLMFLLRAVVAPLYLVGTVLLSYGTALGLSSWLFQEVLGQPGISFYLPILVFVLLVSLGSDYNIFLMSRVREESEGRPIRDGIRIASARTGAVITSAGLILAGTFGSMATASLTVLFQVGVAVALGVLIDTFVVRSILVPAITMLFGERAWWPSGSALARRGWPVVVTFPEPRGAGAGMSRRRLGVALAIVALLPMLVAGLFVWSVANREANLDAVTAAIVDLDAGTMVANAGGTRRLDLGADLAAELTTGTGAETFAWVATDADDARAGLTDGRYGAVLTIPADFSATIASITGDTADANKATLGLQTNDGTSYALGSLASSVSAAIAASTSHSVTANYVDHVLVAVNGTRDDMTGAADRADDVVAGSTDLADVAAAATTVAEGVVAGLEDLADGIAAAGDGVGDLAAGIGRLASGTDRIADGATTLGQGAHTAADGALSLAGGVDRLAVGLGTLAASTADLPAQTSKLASGAHELADGVTTLGQGAHTAADGVVSLAGGVDKLAGGLGTLAASTADLPAQTSALAAGARGVADGAAGTATGARSLADGLTQLAAGTTGLGTQAAALDAGAGALETGAGDLAAGASALAQGAGATATGAQDLALGAGQYAAAVQAYTGSVAALAASCAALGGTDPLCGQLQGLADSGGELAAGAAGLAGSAAGLAAGVDDVASGVGRLAAGATGLTGGADAVHTGTSQLAAQAPQLESGIAASAAGAAALADGASRLATGADSLANGSATFAASVPALSGAISDAAGGARTLADGAGRAAAGMAKLATGVDELATGANALASGSATFAASVPALSGAISDAAGGARTLADGAGSMAVGVAKLATGVDGLATGARTAADGASQLASGTEAAADGASQLASGMDRAAEGARLVAAEVDGLAADGRSVADDAGDLATGLRDDAATIPAYSEETRSALGRAVAAPVVVEQSRLNPVASPGAGLAPSILAAALWLGALAIFLVIPALLGALDRRRWWLGALAWFAAGALIGVAQALLTVLAVRFLLGVEVARLPELLVWSAFVAVCFVAVVQALVAVLDNRGWLVALLLLALQVAAAGVIFPVQTAPAILQAVYAVTPFGFAIEGFRALIAGGGPSLAPAFAGLAAWLICSLFVTLAAAYRSVATAPPVPELASA